MHPVLQMALGASAGYLIVKYFTRPEERVMAEEIALMGIAENPSRKTYSERTPRTSRRKGSKRCISRKGGECKWPVGDQYHQRIALAYVKAGRCSMTESPTCSDVVDWIAKYGSGEAKQVAQMDRQSIMASARRAKTRRSRTVARRGRRRYTR